MCTCMHVCVSPFNVCVCVFAGGCRHVCMYACMYACVCMHVNLCIGIRLCVRACMFACRHLTHCHTVNHSLR